MADLNFVLGTTNLNLDSDGTSNNFDISSSADRYYTQSFTNQTTVTVTHNLGKYPSTQIFDSAGDQVEGTINHVSINQLVATFGSSFTGTIICN